MHAPFAVICNWSLIWCTTCGSLSMGKRWRFILNQMHWLMLGVTVILLGLVATLVNLKPQVDENFFFSSSDPQFQESKKIEERFPAGSQLIVSVSAALSAIERKVGARG